MAKHAHTTTASTGRVEPFRAPRRALLGGLAALAASTPPTHAVSGTNSLDAELIQLCADWLAAECVFDREDEVAADEMDAALDILSDRRRLIRDLPAHTPEGMRAKARVVVAEMALTRDDRPFNDHDFAAWSLAQDLLRLDARA